jgi:EAL domain-containing protein (putative c-di-GMP-specific phosphodiesterase class I)
MKNKRLVYYNWSILICFVFMGFFIGEDLGLMLTPMRTGTISTTFAILFFLDNVFSIGLIVLLAYLFSERKRILTEQASTKEYFQNEHFVYTETAFIQALQRKAKRKKLKGVVACLGIKNLNSEILSLYGADAVKEINEIIFRCIYEKWVEKKDYLYAFNILDDFLIYKETDDPQSFFKELRDLSEQILNHLKEPGNLPACRILLGAYPIAPGDKPEQIVQRATYAEKYNLSTRLSDEIIVFSSDMVGQNETNRDLSYELKRALDEEQLEIYYQPKYDIKTGKFFGAEALIRWKHPIRGVLPPSLFIPFAENSGKIIDIDRYVFRHVCQDIQKWEQNDNRLLKISVNLSRKSVYDPSLIDYYRSTLEEYKVNPLLIEIELTESVAAKDTIYVAALLKKFKSMGLSTAIDDFGVGYSSFSSLKKIPFDTLKIDKGFIDDIEIDKKARDMVQCVIDLGHSLEMSVIAEGVQSEAQVTILRKMGLDSIQGYFFSKPLANYDYVKFLGDNPYEKKKREKGAKA